MKISGINQESNQAYNRALVLRTLQHVKHCSRADIARQTNLKQATISHIMNDYIDWGLVEETGSFSGTMGRRTIGVRISDKKYRVIGFRLTRRHYSIGIFTLNCEETGERTHMDIKNSNPEYILESVCDKINQLIRENPEYTFLAVGVSVPGPYYEDSGEVAMISTFQGWWNIRIREIMQARITIPVIVDHDANAGALAESILADGRDMYNAMVYVSAGQGIGAGIVNKGEVFKGSMGIAGEIGHTCVDVHGVACECGSRGCLTMYASTIALTQNVCARLGEQQLSFEEVVDILKSGRPEAVEEFQKMMTYLGVAVINLIYTYNPNCIVIGDEMTLIGPMVLDALTKQLQQMKVTRLVNQVRIELAQLGFDSAYVGAAVIATRYVFDHIGSICQTE